MIGTEEQNVLIEASAGTGKTFSLATRMIRLLVRGVAPEQIVALTFSRAAAREIYARLVTRLAQAAASPEAAAKESREIGMSCTDGAFAASLRRIVGAQHVASIATLDSFIWRMVQLFPLELGFQGVVRIMDDYEGAEAIRAACARMLGSHEDVAALAAAFRDAQGGRTSRTFRDALDRLIRDWRELVLARPALGALSAEDMRRALALEVVSDGAFGPHRTADVLAGAADDRHLGPLVEFLASYRGRTPVPADGLVGRFFGRFLAGEDIGHFDYRSRPPVKIELTPELAAAVKGDLAAAVNLYFVIQLRRMAGVVRLMARVEAEYAGATRATGSLTFADLPRVLARNPPSDVMNLAYRFDERFDHWGLDEFQDTSREQWAAIAALVESAAGGEADRSVTVVGDLKQAIYGWRGGDVAPFVALAGQANYVHKPLDLSYRYGPAIVDFVNRVFGPENLKMDEHGFRAGDNPSVLSAARSPAVATDWLNPDCWRTHKARAGATDYMKIVGAHKDREAGERSAFPGLVRALKAELADIRERKRKAGLENVVVAVLVRTNDQGQTLADELRHAGIPTVWEGESAVSDTPVVHAFLSLLHLAEHPEDLFDWRFVSLTPVLRSVFPGLDAPAAVAARVARDVARLGLGRALRDYAGRLAPDSLDAFSRQRLDALVLAAVAYEDLAESEKGLSGFAGFLAAQTSRDFADPATVKVLTIHRSKGLGFDCVLLPLDEHGSVEKPDPRNPLVGPDWILPHLPESLARFNAKTRAAWEAQCDTALLDNLRTYYVAATRAKKAFYLFLPDDTSSRPVAGGHPTAYFRDLVRQGLGLRAAGESPDPVLYEGGGAGWLEDMAAEEKAKREQSAMDRKPAAPADWATVLPPREVIARATPSGLHYEAGGGADAGVLFGPDRGAGAAKGIEEHARYAEVEWTAAAAARDDFDRALVKPDGFVELWREKRYELVADGTWETGQFDRVVFRRGVDGRMTATVYDFKTNLRRPGEGESAFRARLAATYSGQMAAYRRAVAELAGLPSAAVSTVLLATAIQGAIPV